MKKQVLFLLAICFNVMLVSAQKTEPKPAKAVDEFNYDKISVKERRVVPYPVIRDVDVAYSKLVYRDIDVREKKNLPLKWEKNPLYKILKDNLTKGEATSVPKIRTYKDEEAWGITPMTVQQINEQGGEKQTIEIPEDPNEPEGRMISKDTFSAFEWYKIKKYRIKEEWIFDRQSSMFFARIIAIAPLYEKEIAGVDQPISKELLWVDYRDLRSILVNQEVFNRQNDAMRLSYLDFFELRLFSSAVTGENNAMDYRRISDNPEFKDVPMASLYENERIKNELFTWEHDLWEY